MGCNNFRDMISDYIDGSLNREDRGLLKEHLDSCGSCRAEYSKLSKVVKALQALPMVEAPPDFLVRLNERIEREGASWWKRFLAGLDSALSAAPLKAMTGVAAAVLLMVVILSSTDKTVNTPVANKRAEDTALTMGGVTAPLPVEFVSTNPSSAPSVVVETPTDFIMTILENDPAMGGFQILPHPKGLGALVHTPEALYEVAMDPAEFPIIQAFVEQQTGGLPGTLKEARSLYPIYIRALPSPTKPISPDRIDQ